MKVCLIPQKSNISYMNSLRTAVTKCGFELLDKNLIYSIIACDNVHFNWFENLGSKTGLYCLLIYFLKFALLRLSKLLHKKIILTLHNKRPHEQ